jgi:hypothetical protein
MKPFWVRVENVDGTFEGEYNEPCQHGDTITIEVDGVKITGILVMIY